MYVKIVRLATSSWICMKRVCQDHPILKPYNWVANLSRSSSVPVDSLVGNLVVSYFWFWLLAVLIYTYLVLSTGTWRSVSWMNENFCIILYDVMWSCNIVNIIHTSSFSPLGHRGMRHKMFKKKMVGWIESVAMWLHRA